MGSTLLSEENQFIGFMPLKSYLINKKELKTGTKCPPDKEDLIRGLILKDSLEKLGCTYKKFKDLNSEKSKLKAKDKNVEEEEAWEDAMFLHIDSFNPDS